MAHPKYRSGDYTLEEIAAYLGITRERVRQIEQVALKKLRRPEIGKKLRDYLDVTQRTGGDHVIHTR